MVFENSLLQQIGIYQYGLIETKQIIFSNEVRSLCEGNICGMYGTTWACPPAIGTVGECKEKCLEYDMALVFNAKYNLEDSFDYEGMRFGHNEFKKVCDKLADLVKEKLSDFLLLSNEGCMRCSECTYPYNSCRFPEMPHLLRCWVKVMGLGEYRFYDEFRKAIESEGKFEFVKM